MLETSPRGCLGGFFVVPADGMAPANDRKRPRPSALLNEAQRRALLCGFLDIHRRMADLEALLAAVQSPSAFSDCENDLTPTDAKVLERSFCPDPCRDARPP